MNRPSAKFIADGLARLAKTYPATPPRFAEITIEIVEPITVAIKMTPLRLARLRSLFPDRTNTEILNELIDSIFDRFGVND